MYVNLQHKTCSNINGTNTKTKKTEDFVNVIYHFVSPNVFILFQSENSFKRKVSLNWWVPFRWLSGRGRLAFWHRVWEPVAAAPHRKVEVLQNHGLDRFTTKLTLTKYMVLNIVFKLFFRIFLVSIKNR